MRPAAAGVLGIIGELYSMLLRAGDGVASCSLTSANLSKADGYIDTKVRRELLLRRADKRALFTYLWKWSSIHTAAESSSEAAGRASWCLRHCVSSSRIKSRYCFVLELLRC